MRCSRNDKGSEATAVTTDSDQNIYVTGFVSTVAHDTDFLTIKYDENGTLLWQKRYNGPGNDVDRGAAPIAVDSQGAVYVTGESDNGGGNGSTHLAGTGLLRPSNTMVRPGRQIWVQRYNGPDDGGGQTRPAARQR